MNIFQPVEQFSYWFSHEVLSISSAHLSKALEFFLYDSIKILLLIIVITHLMSLIRFYLPIEKLRDFLANHNLFGLEYFLASIFGAITPFCSCSSIPLFVGFMEARIPLGVTFSFLITSPLINEVAIALFAGVFGWKMALSYLIAGILIGTLGGMILGKLRLEKYVAKFVWNVKSQDKTNTDPKQVPIKQVLRQTSKEAWSITRKIALYVLVGVAIGGLIHGYVPENFFETYLSQSQFLGVPLAVLLAVPLYSNASGVIPIIQSLIAKGVPLGTGLAFMMATVGLSLPEAMILKRVLKWKLLAIFFGIVTLGIIIIGYIFNFLW